MTESRAIVPARRLLALLAEDDAIGTEPIADVHAELVALGCDPAPTIALTRRLAAGQGSPARRLLDDVARAEADEQDFARLEQADLATIKAQLPAANAAAMAARLRGRADDGGKVVELRRRRRAYGWGGLAAAASIMLVVAVSWRVLEVEPTPMAGDDALFGIAVTSRAEPAIGGMDAAQPVAAAPAPAVPPELESAYQLGLSRQSAETLSDLRVGARLQEVRLSPDAVLAALMIVDPRLAPPTMRSRSYPEGDLATQLPQARKLAAGRAVVALVRLQDATTAQDLVVMARPAEEAEKSEAAIPASLRALLGDTQAFVMIPLPAR
jgi:hypothetical protein